MCPHSLEGVLKDTLGPKHVKNVYYMLHNVYFTLKYLNSMRTTLRSKCIHGYGSGFTGVSCPGFALRFHAPQLYSAWCSEFGVCASGCTALDEGHQLVAVKVSISICMHVLVSKPPSLVPIKLQRVWHPGGLCLNYLSP